MHINLDTLFMPGDLVCLRAHVALPSDGPPQILSVVAVQITGDVSSKHVGYLCRPLVVSLWSIMRQGFYANVTTEYNLPRFSESELVAYDPAFDVAAKEAMKGGER